MPAWHLLFYPIYIRLSSLLHTQKHTTHTLPCCLLCSLLALFLLSSASASMEAGPKSPSPETSISDEMAGNFPELIDQLSPDMPIEEELIEEVMQELYKEMMPTPATATCTKPSSPVENFPTQSLVVGNGKSESCGASVSDLASTVMAGIKFVGPTGKIVGLSPENEVGAWSECGVNNALVVGKGVMDGCDAGEAVDDEWFERVMNTLGPVDLDTWF